MSYIFEPQEPDYAFITRTVKALSAEYPFLRLKIIGHSACRRKLFSLSLGRSERPVIMAACFHAQERLTALVTLKFIDRLCRSTRDGSELCGIDAGGALRHREIIFIPCVNPDGVEIALRGADTAGKYAPLVERAQISNTDKWNSNARGVDLNHNFNAGWDISKQAELDCGISAPSPRRFGGYAPETEPEVQALVSLCRRRLPRTVTALHSQGEEIYYSYGAHTPPRSEHLARLFAASSGYMPVENSGLASHAGFKDWVTEELRIPSFTFELGKGENPLPISDFHCVYEKTEEMLLLSCVM